MHCVTRNVLILMVAGALSTGCCKLLQGLSEESAPAPAPAPQPAPAPTPTEPPAAASDVVRYPDSEVADQGTLTVRNAVRARKSADLTSEIVATLGPGSEVERVARYGGFTLVAWTTDSGEQTGWVDATAATRTVTVVPTVTTSSTTSTAPAVVVRPPPGGFKPQFVPKAPATTKPTTTGKKPVLKAPTKK